MNPTTTLLPVPPARRDRYPIILAVVAALGGFFGYWAVQPQFIVSLWPLESPGFPGYASTMMLGMPVFSVPLWALWLSVEFSREPVNHIRAVARVAVAIVAFAVLCGAGGALRFFTAVPSDVWPRMLSHACEHGVHPGPPGFHALPMEDARSLGFECPDPTGTTAGRASTGPVRTVYLWDLESVRDWPSTGRRRAIVNAVGYALIYNVVVLACLLVLCIPVLAGIAFKRSELRLTRDEEGARHE